MLKNTLGDLEGLQQELNNFSFDMEMSDIDSISLASCSTKATSVCSSSGLADADSSFTEKGTAVDSTASHDHDSKTSVAFNSLPLSQKTSSLGDRLDSSALVLECLHDMVAQENASIEAAISSFCESLETSVAMNSFNFEKKSLFPLNKL
ncbi:hypothetical protein JCM33374_g5036 [Metschnikowia sp. JCM 33374]|nr:hypothetical protein JCM33374_g5036 [Metschnikowia sp. JCM 33374]